MNTDEVDDAMRYIENNLKSEKETKVDVGNWIKLILFFILMALVINCSNSILIQHDIREIKNYIINVGE